MAGFEFLGDGVCGDGVCGDGVFLCGGSGMCLCL